MEIINPLQTQDQNSEEILNLDPDEIIELEETEDSTISIINNHDVQDDED